jgi:hypothetical protein
MAVEVAAATFKLGIKDDQIAKSARTPHLPSVKVDITEPAMGCLTINSGTALLHRIALHPALGLDALFCAAIAPIIAIAVMPTITVVP